MLISKYIKGVAIGLSALMLTSCASDYLDTPTNGSVPAADICKTPESARQAMLGVFGLGMNYLWTSRTGQPFWQGENGLATFFGEIPSSDCYVNYIYDLAPSWVLYYNMHETALTTGGYVWNTPYWYYCYTMMAQTNEIIALIDGAEVGDDADKIALRDFTKGQALAQRAFCYWHLLQVYAPRWEDSNNGEMLCVPLRLTDKETNDKAAATMNEVFDQCYADLDKSIECFKAAGKSFRTLTYENDINVAYGVYARIAALKHDWEKVAEMAHNARQGFRLATNEEAFSGYTSYNKNEWMWASSLADVDWMGYSNWCTWFACNGAGACEERATMRINRDLYNQLPKEDLRSNWWFTYDKLKGVSPAMFYSSKGVYPSTLAIKADAAMKAARTWLNDHKPANITGSNAYDGATTGDKSTSIICDGAQIKFWINGLLGQEGMCTVPYMRATEMYLYEAEALAELGRTSEAQALLMEINKERNPSYTCTLTGQALIDEVRLYRRIELWGEGFNWFDIKRWNIPMVRTAWEEGNQNSGNIPVAVSCDVPTSQNLGWRYGIPQSERSYNMLITSATPGAHVATEE